MKMNLEEIIQHNNKSLAQFQHKLQESHDVSWCNNMRLQNLKDWVNYTNRRIKLDLFNEDFLAVDPDTQIIYIREE